MKLFTHTPLVAGSVSSFRESKSARKRFVAYMLGSLLVTFGLAAPAAAAELLFSFDDTSARNIDLSFVLLSEPVPTFTDGISFRLNTVQVSTTVNSVTTTSL